MTRYIFVTGGVLSALGKGIAASSIAVLLQRQGFKVRIRKGDPYINFDCGTMNPYQHGEVFVTYDGGETDLDLGHYERFTGTPASKHDNITTGRIYFEVIEKERRGEYLGNTVQVIPHITDAIKQFITHDTQDDDFIIFEVGGTIGDIEGLPFVEAIRQLGYDLGWDRCLYIHLTLVPYIATAKELKTKPSQHSVQQLLSLGIQPNMLLCRSSYPLPEALREKLALFCNVPKKRVFDAIDVSHIYEVPLRFDDQAMAQEICDYFKIKVSPPEMQEWAAMVQQLKNPKHKIALGIIGKYAELPDAYKSLLEALAHAGLALETDVEIAWVPVEDLTPEEAPMRLAGLDALIVPGGFGARGTEGKKVALAFAREHKIPCLGICLGMQLMVIEFAQNVLGIQDADSTEFRNTSEPVVSLMRQTEQLGGTLRLGNYPCLLQEGSQAFKIYGASLIEERHRHRYEVNTSYQKDLEAAGLLFSGMSPDGKLPEIVEVAEHPWMVGVQFHPEFKSTPLKPHPLFVGLVQAALGIKKEKK